jgi:hypothetical protein
MKIIRFSPKKLDALADEYFKTVQYWESNPDQAVTTTYLEGQQLAGIGLRRWANDLRKERRLARDRRK